MSKFTIGDKAKVKSNLKDNKFYDNQLFVNNMNKYLGETITIKSINNYSYGTFYETLETEDYIFTDMMLEPIENDCIDLNKVIKTIHYHKPLPEITASTPILILQGGKGNKNLASISIKNKSRYYTATPCQE